MPSHFSFPHLSITFHLFPGNTSVDEFEEDKPEADAAPTNTTNQKMSANLNNDLKNSCLIS
jgi:hypothetical protein